MDDHTSTGGQLFGVDRRVLALALARMADAVGNSFLIIVLPLYVASDAVGGRIFGVPASMVAGYLASRAVSPSPWRVVCPIEWGAGRSS